MKERPILFSAPMVRAILEGRKTQTRRVVKPRKDLSFGCLLQPHELAGEVNSGDYMNCPYGKPGDRLWVRETWQYYDWTEEGEPCIRFSADNATTWPEPGTEDWANKLVDVWEILSRDENYSIDNRARDRRWRPSIHMPRWASRIMLEITGVRIERLADISKDDAMAEGIVLQTDGGFGLSDSTHYNFCDPTDSYASLWESINGAGSWFANPWVWVVEFKRVQE